MLGEYSSNLCHDDLLIIDWDFKDNIFFFDISLHSFFQTNFQLFNFFIWIISKYLYFFKFAERSSPGRRAPTQPRLRPTCTGTWRDWRGGWGRNHPACVLPGNPHCFRNLRGWGRRNHPAFVQPGNPHGFWPTYTTTDRKWRGGGRRTHPACVLPGNPHCFWGTPMAFDPLALALERRQQEEEEETVHISYYQVHTTEKAFLKFFVQCQMLNANASRIWCQMCDVTIQSLSNDGYHWIPVGWMGAECPNSKGIWLPTGWGQWVYALVNLYTRWLFQGIWKFASGYWTYACVILSKIPMSYYLGDRSWSTCLDSWDHRP